MWILVPDSASEKSYYLVVGKEYGVGRKEPSDIIVPNDMSISRKHASFHIIYPENHVTHPEKLPQLILKDLSKFGTSVKGAKVGSGNEVSIRSGDEIQFGSAGTSRYRGNYESYLVTTSCLDQPSKKSTKQLVCQLGGHVAGEWTKDCQLVVMNNLSVTIKVICALVSMKPIVTPKYLEDFLKAIKGRLKLPDPHEYLPPIAESQIEPNTVSFNRNSNRKKVFEGKLFIFLTPKQFKKLSLAVELGGGIPMLAEEGTDDFINDDIIVQPNTCVMNFDPNLDQSQSLSKNAVEWISKVMKLLESNNRRSIAESEVGFAVLYCSTEIHCNPAAQPSQDRPGSKIPPQTLTQAINLELSEKPHTRRTPVKSEHTSGLSPAMTRQAQVKKEPLSQRSSQSVQKTRHSNNTETMPPNLPNARDSMKPEPVTPQLRKVKPEKATPRHETTQNTTEGFGQLTADAPNDDVDEFDLIPRRGRRARKPSPAPPSPTPVQVLEEAYTSCRGKRGRNNDSSVSPNGKRTKRSPGEPTQPPVTTVPDSAPYVDSDIDLDSFDDIPTRRRTRKPPTQVKTSPKSSPVKAPVVASPAKASRRTSPVRGEVEDVDDFDDIPTRGRRTQHKSTKEAEISRAKRPITQVANTDSDDPSTVQIKQSPKNTSPTKKRRKVAELDDDFSSVPQRRRNTGKPAETGRSQVEDPEDDGGTGSDEDMFGTNNNGIKTSPGNAEKQELRSPGKGAQQTVTSEPQRLTKERRSVQPAAGWLRAGADITANVETTSQEEGVPTGLITSEAVSLLVRRPGQRRSAAEPEELGGNLCRWGGNVVKNFKNFKKAHQTKQLPRIIGGTDLVAYTDNMKYADNWFQDGRQAESDRLEYEKIAEEMFESDENDLLGRGRVKGRARGRRK